MRILPGLLLLIIVCGASAANPPTVLVIGDSLSAGYGIDVDQSWTTLLQSRLQSQGYEHRVVNASISGDTTEGGASRIAAALENFGPDLVILELGGNDGLRGIPPDRMKDNLRAIIETSQESGASVIMLGIRIPSNYGPRYTSAFEGVYRELAEQLQIPWIEFFMEAVALDETLMQADGIHPNAKAQPILLDNAWPIVSQALADRDPGNQEINRRN
jgi:acyl-CoA thioesterase-1